MQSKVELQRYAGPLYKLEHLSRFKGFQALVDMSNFAFQIAQKGWENHQG